MNATATTFAIVSEFETLGSNIATKAAAEAKARALLADVSATRAVTSLLVIECDGDDDEGRTVATVTRERLTLHDYATGDVIRELDDDETVTYMELIADDSSGTGAVDGDDFGSEGTVYAS